MSSSRGWADAPADRDPHGQRVRKFTDGVAPVPAKRYETLQCSASEVMTSWRYTTLFDIIIIIIIIYAQGSKDPRS